MQTEAQIRRTEKFREDHAFLNVAVTRGQKEAIKAEAQRRGITISELVRRQIQRYWA